MGITLNNKRSILRKMIKIIKENSRLSFLPSPGSGEFKGKEYILASHADNNKEDIEADLFGDDRQMADEAGDVEHKAWSKDLRASLHKVWKSLSEFDQYLNKLEKISMDYDPECRQTLGSYLPDLWRTVRLFDQYSSKLRAIQERESFSNLESDELLEVTAEEVFNVIVQVFECHPELEHGFNQAFRERATQPGLVESKGLEGMVCALSQLLWRTLPDEYLDPHRYATPLRGEKQEYSETRTSIKKALNEIVARDSWPLQVMTRQLQRAYLGTLFYIVRGLLAFYIDNKDTYPYD